MPLSKRKRDAAEQKCEVKVEYLDRGCECRLFLRDAEAGFLPLSMRPGYSVVCCFPAAEHAAVVQPMNGPPLGSFDLHCDVGPSTYIGTYICTYKL